jgi:hypothetical protein
MKRLSFGSVSGPIALLMVMAASVLPAFSQDVQTFQSAPAAQSTSEETRGDFKPGNSKSSAEAASTEEPKNKGAVDSTQGGANQAPNQSAYVFPTKRERFNRYVGSVVGPFSLLSTGISAGINQWRDRPVEWEQGASGYGKRYASEFGRTAIQQTIIYGLDTAVGLDTGFKRSNRKGFFPRMTHALAENITSRTRTGKRVISIPRISGIYASRIISEEAWYPARYGYKDGLRSGTSFLLAGFGINLIREFIIGR